MPIRRTLLLLAVTIAANITIAQTPATPGPETAPTTIPQFDVISVKPDKTNSGMTRMMMTPDGINATNVPIHMLITQSYALNDDQILGEPGWAKSDRFDIEAKVAGPDVPTIDKLTLDQRRSMNRQILTDRFKLAAHNETRELPAYVLSVARGGPKFKESKYNPDNRGAVHGSGRFSMSRGKLSGQEAEMPFIVSILSRELGRTVIDKTGLPGKYEITLQWTPDGDAAPPARAADSTQPGASPSPTDSGPSIFTAIQEQLGLKLDSTKGPVPVLVIDDIEKPAEN